jgi:hypothetical protein
MNHLTLMEFAESTMDAKLGELLRSRQRLMNFETSARGQGSRPCLIRNRDIIAMPIFGFLTLTCVFDASIPLNS